MNSSQLPLAGRLKHWIAYPATHVVVAEEHLVEELVVASGNIASMRKNWDLLRDSPVAIWALQETRVDSWEKLTLLP